MIFNNRLLSCMATRWQVTRNPMLLERVFAGSKGLVEAIASRYDPSHRDDLIQESYLKIQYALPFYNPDISSLYNYLSAVARNACVSYLRKISKELLIPEGYDMEVLCEFGFFNKDVMSQTIERNRQRFPSLPVDVIDGATEYIYYAVTNGVVGKSHGIVKNLCEEFWMSRHIAIVVYHSTLIYLRHMFIDKIRAKEYNAREFSLLMELEDIVGTALFKRISILMSGMYVKIP